MDFQQYIDNGLNYTDYLKKIADQLYDLEQLDQENDLIAYYQLNLKRLERINKKFQLTGPQKQLLQSIDKRFKLLTISEGWCGDAAQILPVVDRIASEMNLVHRIVLRDENLELIDQFLTNGSRSIPIIIGLDDNNQVQFTYGPRPKHGMELTKKFQQDPSVYSKEEFHKDLQLWYNEDQGKSIANELIKLFK